MKTLKDILYKVPLLAVSGDMSSQIESVCFDSRKAQPSCVFVAIRGSLVDGHKYIKDAINAGAKAIVCEEITHQATGDVAMVQVKNSSEALSTIASNFYDNPSSKITLVGITGTNGKTTTVTLLHQLFKRMGYNCGMLSTICNKIKDDEVQATRTTPDPIQINQLIALMLDKGCTHCFMEVSSHAIDQNRTYGLDFDIAVFSNITHDHLDYHHTFNEYIKAKKKLFDQLPSHATAIVNIDDKRGLVMLQNTKANSRLYALKTINDFKGRVISSTLDGMEMDIDGRQAWFRLIGNFNAYNLLATYATAITLGENEHEVLLNMSSLSGASGRFERVAPESNVIAIIDYAHTPNALENVLLTIKEFRTGNEQVITVIGCGGNRDKSKRPIMAEVAVKYSDKVILTSDNPRGEDPEAILADMEKGVPASNFKKVLKIVERKEAIKTAGSLADDKDIILVAGKGHETYQEIKGVKHAFDDRLTLKKAIKLIN